MITNENRNNNLFIQSSKLLSDEILKSYTTNAMLDSFTIYKSQYQNHVEYYNNSYLESEVLNIYHNVNDIQQNYNFLDFKLKIQDELLKSLRNSTYTTLTTFQTQYTNKIFNLDQEDARLQQEIIKLKDFPLDHFVIGHDGVNKGYLDTQKYFRFKNNQLSFDSFEDLGKDLEVNPNETNEYINNSNDGINIIFEIPGTDGSTLKIHKNVNLTEGQSLRLFEGGVTLDKGEFKIVEGDLKIITGNISISDGNISTGGILKVTGSGADLQTNPNEINGGLKITSGLDLSNSDLINGGILEGTATKAHYADLAERYTVHEEYVPGTVLQYDINGNSDAVVYDGSAPYFGVVSDKPGFVLNSSENEKGYFYNEIALKGKTPVICSHYIKKGMYIIPDQNQPGAAKGVSIKPKNEDIIGIALSNSYLKDGFRQMVQVKI